MSMTYQITPINETSNIENVYEQVHKFLNEILSNNILKHQIVARKKVRNNDDRMFSLITTNKDEQYVVCDGGLERLIGSVYLQKALTNDHIKKFGWKTARTKVMPTIKTLQTGEFTITIKRGIAELNNLLLLYSDDFIPFSEYIGEEKPHELDFVGIKKYIQETTGFWDMVHNANIRIYKGSITIIDTEYNSFNYNGMSVINRELINHKLTFNLSDFQK